MASAFLANGTLWLAAPRGSGILHAFRFAAVSRHLVYTLALDHPPGAIGHLTMAKYLVMSLLRTRFNGDIVVFKNSEMPLFMLPRAGVREIFIETPDPGGEHFWDYAQSFKFRVRHHLEVAGYDKVLFLDADCLALRSIEPLLEGDWDIGIYPEPGSRAGMHWFNCFISESEAATTNFEGINGGTLAVRAELFYEVMAEWERIHFGPAPRPKYFADQAALTRLVIDSPLRKRRFVRGEVATPFAYDHKADSYMGSRLVHLAGTVDFDLKLRFMFGLYMSTFFFDRDATLLNILDF
jgi:hypothetical protein